jgi:4-amino-4-deoxy-L-arabinose transferase-like glycosyltransferase
MAESQPLRRFRGLPLVFFTLLALGAGFINLTGDLMNDDEGNYLYSAWRMSIGERPYADFTSVQTPLSFAIMAVVFKIVGPSVGAARAASFLVILAAALLIYAASRRALRLPPWASAAAAAGFLFTKHIYFLGRSFMPDDFMLLWGAAALYFFLRAEENGRTRDYILAGFMAGLAALSKLNGALILAGFILSGLWAWIYKKYPARLMIRSGALLTAGFLASFGLPFLALILFVPGTIFQTIGFHAGKSGLAEGNWLSRPFIRLVQFVGNHNYGLVPLAAAGMGFSPAATGAPRTGLFFSAAVPFVFLFLPGRFFIRYVLFALVPLALFFGAGLEGMWRRKKPRLFVLPAAIAAIALSLGPTLAPARWTFRDHGTRDLVAYVQNHTGAEDFVFGDDPFINFLAQRPCPGGLVDVSEAWTKSGLIASADIRRQCEAKRVALIFVEKGHSAHHLVALKDYPEFQAYLDEKFQPPVLIKREFLDVEVYLRRAP